MVSDLTGLPLANASLLDEGTAAAEAMVMFFNATRDQNRTRFLVSRTCHPQTIDILKTRSEPLGIELDIVNHDTFSFDDTVFGILVQYPDTEGSIQDFSSLCHTAHENKSYFCMATDLLALTILKPPGEMGADAAVGNAQRFGVPMGYGGPHAAFFSATEEFKRKIRDESLVYPRTYMETLRFGWRSRPGSSISVEKKPHPIFAQPRFYWLSCPGCMRSIMGQKDSPRLHKG
jgi:glycine dehydrogenase